MDFLDRRRSIISSGKKRTLLGTGTTGQSGVTWTMWSDGELDISAQTEKDYIGSINGWSSDWSELVTTVSINNIRLHGNTKVGTPTDIFSTFVNCKTLHTWAGFARATGNVVAYIPFNYTDWMYDGDLSAWCYQRSIKNGSSEDALPGANGQFNLYLNGTLLSGDVTLPAVGTRGTLAGVLNINTLRFSNSITSFPDYVLYGCTAKNIILNEGLTTINSHAIQSALVESIEFSSTVRTVEASALRSCARLISVTFPLDSVRTFNSDVFRSDSALTSIVFPKSTVSVGPSICTNCAALSLADFSACESVPAFGTGSTIYTGFDDCASGLKIRVPASLVDGFKAALPRYSSKIVSA